MDSDEFNAIFDRLGLSQGALAAQVGIKRPTINKYLRGRSVSVPLVIANSIRWVLSQTELDPLRRRKTNSHIPPALSEKKCLSCGSGLWWVYSKGEKRDRLNRCVFQAHCKAHTLASSTCPETSLFFDGDGNRITMPRRSPREFKKLPFERPRCQDCELEMKSGKTATRRTVNSKNEVDDEEVFGFFCAGGRFERAKHALRTVYTNPKGGIVEVLRGKHKNLGELPWGLRRRYPVCCAKPMSRQGPPYQGKSGKRVWWFLCRVCKKSGAFDDSGKPHVRYHRDDRIAHYCPECKKPMVKAKKRKTAPDLQSYVCNNYGADHLTRVRHFHTKNGREYRMERNRGTWEAHPLKNRVEE